MRTSASESGINREIHLQLITNLRAGIPYGSSRKFQNPERLPEDAGHAKRWYGLSYAYHTVLSCPRKVHRSETPSRPCGSPARAKSTTRIPLRANACRADLPSAADCYRPLRSARQDRNFWSCCRHEPCRWCRPILPPARYPRLAPPFRRWTRMKSTITNRTPETIRMTLTVSIDILSSSNLICQKLVMKLLLIEMIAGTSSTINILGKIKNTNGNTSLTVVFAAISSACCRRRVRMESAK